VSRDQASPIGIVPIVWNNADLVDLAPPVPADLVMDEVARLGFDGLQLGNGFPEGVALRETLAVRKLRLAEVYTALPCGPDGPTEDALAIGRARLAELHAAAGEVLVIALAFSPGRLERSGRASAPDAPVLSSAGWSRLARTVEAIGRETNDLGHRAAFHNHAGTYVETAAELDRLAEATDPAALGLCLDVGHLILGGGDPVPTVRKYGARVTHFHMKDVASVPLRQLRDGTISGFHAALRARIFTELGSGELDVPGTLAALAAERYRGWIMLEQDSTWRPPSESAAISRAVLDFSLRLQAREPRAA
jgi:inosose dehydratase